MMRTNDYGSGILTLSIITPSIATLETQRYPGGCVLFGSSVPVSVVFNEIIFKGTSLVSLMSYSLDVYTYISLNHEVKTCDGIYSRCI